MTLAILRALRRTTSGGNAEVTNRWRLDVESKQTDPIMAELRAVRDALSEQAGHDPRRLGQMIREMQEKSGRTYIKLPQRVPKSRQS